MTTKTPEEQAIEYLNEVIDVRAPRPRQAGRGLQEGHPPDAPIVAWWTKEVES